MDLSITPCVLSLLLVGISYAQEIKVYPSYKSIRRETSQNGLLITCEVDGLADDQNANLEWLDPADNVIGPYNSAIKSRIYSRQMGTSNQNLRFDTLKDGDEGVYTCRGTIGGNTITNDIRLELYDGIKVLSNHTQQPNIYTDAVIACAVTANPSPTVQWTFGNGTKVRGERYRLLPQGLEIKNITMADNGVYICSIILIETGDLLPFHINVTVTVPPSLKGPPTRSTAIVGKRFEMTCVADGTPRPSFTFKKDKLVLSGQRYKVSITNDVNETRGMLVIEHLQNTDEGTYSCIAHNQGGNVSESVFIDTIAPPIIEPIINKTEPEGYAVELVCVAKGDPAPMVTWRVKGSDIPISASQDITIEYQHEKLPLIQVTTVKLKFARLEQKNANNYTCSASNEAGTVEKDGNVVVQFKPYFADTPYSSTYGWVNHKSEIKCVANAVPLAVIIWKYNDAIITDGPFFSISSKQGNRQMISILEVSVNVENENTIFRNFTCEALNLLGKSEKVFTLKQAVEPASPTISIGVMTPMTIELIITPPEETGGPPVTDYRVVYYAKGDEQNRFARMAPVGTNSQKFETQLLLDNLEANVLYVISAEARNSVGYGAKAAIFVSTPAVRQPSPPKVTSPRSSDTPHTYLLVWEKPETGGSPLTGYKVRYYQVELYDGNPEKVKTVVGDRKTLTISQDNKTEVRLTELMPNSTYELQITAINAIGVSMATRKLVTTPPVQFKPNFADTPYSSTYGWVNHKSEIKCVANAVPPAVIIWKYSDAIITDGPFFSISSKQRNRQMISILEVSVNVENENTIFGKFTCVAENTLGVSEKDIILKQAVKPSAPSISVDRLTPRSFRLLITKSQETGGPPIINYMIVYYAQDDVKNKFKMRVPVNANPEELQTQVFIDYLEAKVKYNIRVKARNSVGYGAKAKISAKTLVYPPLSLEVPAIVNDPIVGTKFVMTCSAKGSPYPSLIFQKDNTTLSGERYKMGVLNDVDRTDGILLIEHLRNTDEGTYSCVAHNQGGNVSESVFIDTIVPPIIEPIINKTEREGNAVELVCVAKGDPAPMVTWRVKGSHSPISDSPVVRVFTIEEHVEVKPPIHVRAATLTFTRLQPEHANNYTCTAANVAGTDEKDGNIIVEWQLTNP
ncbi:hemicentin-1-like isoform X2 [Haliotis rufescens]|uniref:hemicentin-1-like isoform X2 n=1 Tax=Haliotis rufescens TaxID=6454 RepID=UPI00201EFBED|nr:hemicentin-1-like isoform X2 [Haliotis rufescens]